MKVVTAAQMLDIDQKTTERFGIPSGILMERAGVAVAAKVRELFDRRKVIVLAGGGNNGGDGIVAARELYNTGWNVKVLLLIREDRLSPDCLAQFRTAKQMGVPVELRTDVTGKDLHSSVVVDAMLGTGLNKNVEGAMAKVIGFLNTSGSPVLSVDIPSGISSDTGQVMGVAVQAAYTVTFGLPKRGHFLHPGAEYTGELFIEDIGFPEGLLNAPELNVELPEPPQVMKLIPARPAYSHKGDYGRVLVVAGSRGKTGAALMAAKACLRAGAGLVTIGVPESLMDVFQCRVTEEMTLPLPDRGDGTLRADAARTVSDFLSATADVLALGPGIGVSDDTVKLVRTVIQSSSVPIVLDADGINALAASGSAGDILKNAGAPVILTPHPGEMARLLSRVAGGKGTAAKEAGFRSNIEKDRIHAAVSFSSETATCLVLKGVPTVIAEPGGRVFISSTGNPGMATGGTGDVLTGMIAAFLGQKLAPPDAAVLGVFLHGLAGDLAAAEKGLHSLIASDIIECLPAAFRDLAAAGAATGKG